MLILDLVDNLTSLTTTKAIAQAVIPKFYPLVSIQFESMQHFDVFMFCRGNYAWYNASKRTKLGLSPNAQREALSRGTED